MTNMREIDRIVQLLKRHWEGDNGQEMAHELEALFHRYAFLEKMVADLHQEDMLRDALRQHESLFDESSPAREDKMLQQIIATTHPAKRHNSHRAGVWKYAVAASILVVFTASIWFMVNNLSHTPSPIEQVAALAPGSNKAVLILPDGRQLALSAAHEGIVVGKALMYKDHTPLLDEPIDVNNSLTMATPRGGQYQLLLHDGTKIWLNAESKLRYPPVFSGDQRAVWLEGEAYFEVAKASTPFIVHTPNERVEVLGTHFNVNAYRNETTSAVSLLEGKVNVSLADATGEILLPGQQSIVTNNTLAVRDVDVLESVAWKNGEFMFNKENLDAVMRKLARWYDIEIDVAPELADIQIWGSLSRYDNFAEVLRIIKMTDNDIQFSIKGRRVKLMK